MLVTTSTHIQRPEQYPTLLTADAAAVAAALATHGVVCVAGETAEGKLCAPALSFELLAALADFVLVEADGSKRLPQKAHAPHEPVIPPNACRTVYVVGADGFGHPIRQVCHRPERYAALCGAAEDDIVTPALEAAVLHAEATIPAGSISTRSKPRRTGQTPKPWRPCCPVKPWRAACGKGGIGSCKRRKRPYDHGLFSCSAPKSRNAERFRIAQKG